MSTELAWAAGFFDGEGGSTAGVIRTTTRLRLHVTQNDRRPLNRFMKAIGGVGSIHGPIPRYKGSSPNYKWELGHREKVYSVMKLLWPYLSEPKKEQWLRDIEKEHILREGLHDRKRAGREDR